MNPSPVILFIYSDKALLIFIRRDLEWKMGNLFNLLFWVLESRTMAQVSMGSVQPLNLKKKLFLLIYSVLNFCSTAK